LNLTGGDVTTTTLENRARTLADNITNNNAVLYRLRKKGKEKPFDGGREIMQPLRYAQNQTFTWYSGYEFLPISLNDTMTAARFPIKQAAIAVTLSGLEDLQNGGEYAMMDLLEERVETAEDTFWNAMSAGVYSDGTAFSGKQIGGLALLISKVPTVGIVGGIDASAQVWWRNLSVNANTDAKGVITTSNVVQYFNQMALNLKRNSDGINLIVADTNIYGFYLQALQAIQRITTDDEMTGAGFTALEYFGAGKRCAVVLDGGKNGQIPTNTAYFLNEDYIQFRPHARRNFKVIGKDRANVNQDAIVRIMAWAGNMTILNRSLQGVLWM
jgi:hypothetical protein